MVTSPPSVRAYAHVLAVPDLARSVRYFRDVLGFHAEWEDGGNWSCLARGSARVMIGHCPDATPPAELGDHGYFAYFHVDDVDAVHTEIAARGALVLEPPADKPWGLREMPVRTPDGHRMMFGEVLRRTDAAPPPRALHLRRSEVMAREPNSAHASARVWTMRRTAESRTNLVEMRGKLSYHAHPDADHTLLVLSGRVCAWSGTEAIVLEEGDYISIPRGVPHKYETITKTALLMSFDAPAYDPARTSQVPEDGVVFAPCPVPFERDE